MNIDDGYGYHMCSIAYTDNVTYGTLTPQSSTVVLVNSTYVCNTANGTKTWDVETDFDDKYVQSTKTTVDFQENISYSVKIPDIFS